MYEKLSGRVKAVNLLREAREIVVLFNATNINVRLLICAREGGGPSNDIARRLAIQLLDYRYKLIREG